MQLSIIAAVDEKSGIGKNGRIPWDIPEDRLYFKQLTMGHVVIFGRKTFEEIGKPLPGRFNIVVSSTKTFEGENLRTVKTLKEAIQLIKEDAAACAKGTSTKGTDPSFSAQTSLPTQNLPASRLSGFDLSEIFICGGQQLYKEALPKTSKLYLTKVKGDYKCDRFFPAFNEKDFEVIIKNV